MFAQNLKYLRERAGMEQIDLAHKLGRKSSSSVSEWEKGKYTPKIGTLNDISEIFNVSITDLMNIDLSNDTLDSESDILSIYKKLDKKNKRATYDFAKERLREQETGEIRDFYSTRKVETLAAHSDDPDKKYTAEDIERINRRLDEIDRKHGKIKD